MLGPSGGPRCPTSVGIITNLIVKNDHNLLMDRQIDSGLPYRSLTTVCTVTVTEVCWQISPCCPQIKSETLGTQSLRGWGAPGLCNEFPRQFRLATTLCVFKPWLKTHFFSFAFTDQVWLLSVYACTLWFYYLLFFIYFKVIILFFKIYLLMFSNL